jgi:hypothetical protein
MFPVSIAGRVRLEGYLDSDAAMRRLVAAIEDAEADDVCAMGHGVTFRGGMSGSNAASLAVRNDGSATIVEYVLSFRNFLLASSAATGVLAVAFVLSEPAARAVAWFFALAWLLVYGVSVAIATVHFRGWLRKVTASDAPSGGIFLETDEDEGVHDPSPAQIAEVLAKLHDAESSFATLFRNSEAFIQASGAPAEGFVLEYRGSGRLHRSTASNLPLATVTKAFQLYAAGDDEWHSLVTWEPA